MKLCRSCDDRKIAGVCGGLAKLLGWSPFRLRVVFVLTASVGLVIYIALWYLMPEEPAPAPTFESPPLQPWKKAV